MAPKQAIVLEYPVHPRCRYLPGESAHSELWQWFDRQRSACRSLIDLIASQRHALERIPATSQERNEPEWRNGFFSVLDGMALYSLVVTRKPQRIIEVGSGYSTKFAARAIRDGSLSTTITSIDPEPRADVDELCHRVERHRLEDTDQRLFAELQPGDFLLVDSSHRVFTNSDVTTLFLEIIPRLTKGVVLHLHDIFLPWDYPQEWSNRYYSEQYLLAYGLLTAPDRFELIGSNVFVSFDSDLRAMAGAVFANSPLAFMFDSDYAYGYVRDLWGTSLWLEV
jgi:predicted O-methyltransferase YrrM